MRTLSMLVIAAAFAFTADSGAVAQETTAPVQQPPTAEATPPIDAPATTIPLLRKKLQVSPPGPGSSMPGAAPYRRCEHEQATS